MSKKNEIVLNCNQLLKENISKFIEVFVKFYGEKNRSEIEEKLSNVIFVGYQSPESISQNLKKIEENKKEELIDKLLNENKIGLTKEDLFESYYEFDQKNNPIIEFEEFHKLHQLGKEGRKKEYKEIGFNYIKRLIPIITEEEYLEIIQTKQPPSRFKTMPKLIINNILYFNNEESIEKEYQKKYEKVKKILQKINPNITIDNYSQYQNSIELKELFNIIENYKELREEYKELKTKYKEFYLQLSEDEKLKKELNEKYYKQLLNENMELIPIEKQKEVKEYIEGKKDIYLDIDLKNIFGYTLGVENPIISSFSTESDQILSDENESNWKKTNIKNSRIDFFKTNGIDLGNDYENYITSDTVKKIWPSKQLVDKFNESKRKKLNSYKNEFYTNRTFYKNTLLEIESKELINKDDNFDAKTFDNNMTCISTNARIINGSYELFCLMFINFNINDFDKMDHFIVHEMNHIIETSLKKVDEETIYLITGWDECFDKICDERKEVDTLIDDSPKRKYELFNEIINEKIAQEISKLMEENEIYIFNEKGNKKYKHTTSYEHSNFIVDEFYNEFKDKIIESRRNGNINIIWDEVGKENFESLNELFEIYYENFQEFKYYKLLDSLQKKEETELTKIFYDIVEKKNRILEKMRIHKEMNQNRSNYESNNDKTAIR